MATELVIDCQTGDLVARDYTPPPSPVPHAVYPLQIRKALRAAGLMASVKAILAQSSDEVNEAWEYASVITRDNPMLLGAAQALGLSSEQVDTLFREAAKL